MLALLDLIFTCAEVAGLIFDVLHLIAELVRGIRHFREELPETFKLRR